MNPPASLTAPSEKDWRTAKILEPQEAYIIDYPQAEEFTDAQMAVYWLPDEVNVEKDVQDLMVNMTESERHGVITVLKLFVQYECILGTEVWGGLISKAFQRPEIQSMSSMFSSMELCVHARFYNKINEVMNLNTEEFYLSYLDDPLLVDRINFIENSINEDDIPLTLAAFCFLEGCVLYSSFAYLKSFQGLGKNKLMATVRGISMSIRDEGIHQKASAWLFRTVIAESGVGPEVYTSAIHEIASQVYDHESRIVDMIFEKGEIEGIDSHNMKQFIKHRINVCLEDLGLEPIFEDDKNNIAEYFYDATTSIMFHDFFAGMGNSYQRDYSEAGFVW